jgi:hypothetical protein
MAALPSPCFRIASRWLFQFDELDLADRSPIRGTEEHEHGFESLVTALLVLRGKSGYLLAHVWSGLVDLAVQRRDQKSPHRQFDERSLCHADTTQNVNVSSSAIMMTGGPPDDIFTAWARVSLPPADAAHCWSASMDGK